jgi:hypothetical protein
MLFSKHTILLCTLGKLIIRLKQGKNKIYEKVFQGF